MRSAVIAALLFVSASAATCGDQDVNNCCLNYHNCLTDPKFSIGGRWSPCKQAWCCTNKPEYAAKWGDAVSCGSSMTTTTVALAVAAPNPSAVPPHKQPTYFATTDPPKCHVTADGHTVVHYDGALHPSFKCSHTGTNTCVCVSKHPTHHKGACKEFSSVGNNPTHTLSGDCTDTGADAPSADPAIGTTLGTTCPLGGKATAEGCPIDVAGGDFWGDFWPNKCTTTTTQRRKNSNIAVPPTHRYMQVAMVCREEKCTTANTRYVMPNGSISVDSVLKDAELTFDKTTPCTGKCGSGKAQCTPESSFRAAPASSTTYGPIPAGATWSTFGDTCNGNCGITVNKALLGTSTRHGTFTSAAWAYYKSAQCFSGSHCASGTCTNNVCINA